MMIEDEHITNEISRVQKNKKWAIFICILSLISGITSIFLINCEILNKYQHPCLTFLSGLVLSIFIFVFYLKYYQLQNQTLAQFTFLKEFHSI